MQIQYIHFLKCFKNKYFRFEIFRRILHLKNEKRNASSDAVKTLSVYNVIRY